MARNRLAPSSAVRAFWTSAAPDRRRNSLEIANEPAALPRSVVSCDTMSWGTPQAWPVVSSQSLGPEPLPKRQFKTTLHSLTDAFFLERS